MITSNETICAQHGCASTFSLHVHQVHVVHNVHTEYNIQPTALHMRIDIVVLLRWEALRPPPNRPLLRSIQIQACTPCTLATRLLSLSLSLSPSVYIHTHIYVYYVFIYRLQTIEHMKINENYCNKPVKNR